MNISDNTNFCNGCGACFSVCPVNAIKMQESKLGNIEAVVLDNCTNCQLCTKVCAKFSSLDNVSLVREGKLCAAKKTDCITLTEHASGGIASQIATNAISLGYSVVGVVYDYQTNRAIAKIATTYDELVPMKKSKYLQAVTANAFKQLIKEARSDKNKKYVVFGMPCQINGCALAAKQSGLQNEIILVDFFCHGVPSYITWDLYLKEITKKTGKITQIDFRDKAIGWHEFLMKIQGEGLYKKHALFDQFYDAFFDNVLLNKACFKCRARQGETYADIRLGDFWGKRYKKDKDGVSACVILTEKGRKVFEGLKEISRESVADIDECLSSQSMGEYPFQNLNEVAMEMLVKTKKLKRTINSYRKSFSAKKRLKVVAKKIVYFLPSALRDKIKEKF